MAIPNQDMIQQLSGQLHMVSEIAESLTLRLLALEERLTELSECVNSVEPDQAEDSDNFLLLADSSDRLVQLRGLLNERVVDDAQLFRGDQARLLQLPGRWRVAAAARHLRRRRVRGGAARPSAVPRASSASGWRCTALASMLLTTPWASRITSS